MELRRVSEDRWECSDPRYTVYIERDPWMQPGDVSVPMFSICVQKYGAMYYSPLRTEPSLSTALEYIKKDAASPVFDEFGMCRWCDMSRADLVTYPRWWFGCNLCEAEMERTADNDAETEASIAEHEMTDYTGSTRGER
jgi:hypothetical protein